MGAMSSLKRVGLASVPLTELRVLAGLRAEPGVMVTVLRDRAWVRWSPESVAVLQRLLPVPGLCLWERREDRWYGPGQHLPGFDVPEELEHGGLSLVRAIMPEPVRPTTAPVTDPEAIRLRLVREDRVRPATALRCALESLERWASQATTAELARLTAARAGATALVRGLAVPPIAGAERFWGDRLLIPLGFCADPALSEAALLRILEVERDTLAILDERGLELVPAATLRVVTRSGVRLAAGGGLS